MLGSVSVSMTTNRPGLARVQDIWAAVTLLSAHPCVWLCSYTCTRLMAPE